MTGPAPVAPPAGPAPSRGRARRPVRSRARRVGRTLPGTSAATRLRAGTKLGVLVALVVALGVVPAWSTVAAGLGVLAGWAWLGRATPRAWPRPPVWVAVGGVALLALTTLGGEPTAEIAGVPVSLPALERAARLLAVALVTLAGSLLFVATTPVGDLPPLLGAAAARLRRTRGGRSLPADEWAVTASLGLRLAPALVEQARTVAQVVAQRRRSRAPARRGLAARRRAMDAAVTGVFTLVCATAVRRAAETADALVARGGAAGMPAGEGGVPRRTDRVAVLVAVAVLAAGALAAVLG